MSIRKKNKQSLIDVTFLFLVRLDTIDRLGNILSTTQFIVRNFDTNIRVLECSPFNNGLLVKLLDNSIMYSFIEDNDPILFRTKFLNHMTQTVETPFVAVWDTDVIASVDQILNAVELLRNENADFVFPYKISFFDTSQILRKLYLMQGKKEIFTQNMKKMNEMYGPNPVGGAFLAKSKAYKEAGMENEIFYGWGVEDGERVYRWENLGYKMKRVNGSLFHLSHGRGLNSIFHNTCQYYIKHKEITKVIRNMRVDNSHLNDQQITF